MRSLVMALAGLVAVAGCSGDESVPQADQGVQQQLDTGVTADLYPDLGAAPDVAQADPCEKEWTDAISAQKNPATGVVTATTLAGGVMQAEIDATAGGMNDAHNNPYVYISLADGKRVDVDDFAARTSTAWDLAFRRTVIRVNGGDSGAGDGAVAILLNSKLEDVTAVPAAANFTTDDFLDDDCNIVRDPINNILTAFGGTDGMWYEYDVSGSGPAVTPKPQAYVVRRATGEHVKLVITDYYNEFGAGAHFTIQWQAL